MSKQQALSVFEQEVAKKRQRLVELEAPMLRAVEYLKSSQYLTDSLNTLQKINGVVQIGRIDQFEALLLMGRLQQILADWGAQERIIEEYNFARKSLRESNSTEV